jgi:hypothetical protein
MGRRGRVINRVKEGGVGFFGVYSRKTRGGERRGFVGCKWWSSGEVIKGVAEIIWWWRCQRV